ncbi:hypothetical protein BACI349Y_50260 [Bacillus sp. 349Y]|nr:hypothetical protein BACI349Y_50260 [Bacillus sp. 349Y]
MPSKTSWKHWCKPSTLGWNKHVLVTINPNSFVSNKANEFGFFIYFTNIFLSFLAVDWSARRSLLREEWLPAGLPRRLTGYPRKAKSCTEIISGIKNL